MTRSIALLIATLLATPLAARADPSPPEAGTRPLSSEKALRIVEAMRRSVARRGTSTRVVLKRDESSRRRESRHGGDRS